MDRRLPRLALAVLAPLLAGAGPLGPESEEPPPPPPPPPPPVVYSWPVPPPGPAPVVAPAPAPRPAVIAPKTLEARDAPIGDHSPGAVVFLLRAPADPLALALLARVEVVETTPLDSIGLSMVVARLRPGDTPQAAAGRLEALPGVAWAQADHLFQSLGGVSGAFAAPGPGAGPAPGVAAMIDTMVDTGHEAFAGAAVEQRLFAPPMAPGAHGTAVAGLIAGQGRGARLVSLAAFRQPGTQGAALSQTRYLAKALDAAVQLRPNVLNLSFGGPGDRLLETLIGAADARGICIVAAAGNGGVGSRAPFPASHPAVLGVTAVDERLRIYPFATAGRHVDVAAVGVDLTAAAPGGYRRVSGSSFAAAVVSGALLRTAACGRDRDPAAMRAAVVAAARDLGAPGRDDVFGAGLFRLP